MVENWAAEAAEVLEENYDQGEMDPLEGGMEPRIKQLYDALKSGYLVPIPYLAGNGEFGLPLELDSSSKGHSSLEGVTDVIHRLVRYGSRTWNDGQSEDEALEQIFRSAVILYNAKAGTFGECLDTALVWYFG